MFKNTIIVLLHIFVWNAAAESDCVTPLDKPNKCVPVPECSPFLQALNSNITENRTLNFIKQSKCGCDVKNPRVCCGPLPTEEQYKKHRGILGDIDTDSLEDSFLAPEDKCGVDFSVYEDKIFGGNSTDIGESPWLALLWYRKHTNELKYACGGSLINRRYVLTAAHCITGKKYKSFGKLEFVRFGEHDVRKEIDCIENFCGDPPQDIRVLAIYPHPGYADENRNKQHDIGLIRLAKRVRYTDFIKPLCLDRSGKWEVNDEMIVSGWGLTLEGSLSPVKLKIKVPVVDVNDCFKLFRTHLSLTENQLCLGGKFITDSCWGDSGGPAIRPRPDGRWQGIAVVSFGLGCGRDGWPAVYTIVSKYHDWITETLQSSNLCPPKVDLRTSKSGEPCLSYNL